MKTILFATAALAIGGTALAQTTPDTSATTSGTQGTTTVAPANTTPARDARGIPVISDPATAPAGVNLPTSAGAGQVVPAPNQAAAFATQPSTENYPVCSRTVTDNCVQNYERGRRR